MNPPLVSVVMVMCNMDRFLGEAIESILGQSFADFEFIIVDFGSTDGSMAIAASHAARDKRIRLREIPQCSLVEARNAACSLAQGKFIAIMDADDVSLPDRLTWELDFIQNHPEIGFLGGAVEWIDAAGRSLWTYSFPTEDQEIRVALATRNAFAQDATLIRRDAFSRVGGYRRAFRQTHDYDLWLRIAEHFGCANLSQVVLKYRIHPKQVSSRNRRGQILCKLAAQASASFRRSGKPDPADSVTEITPETLRAWGVSEAKQQQELAAECQVWIKNLCNAGEYSAALETAVSILESSDWKYVEPRQLADLKLTVARLYRRQKSFGRSFIFMGQAVAARPAVVGRMLKSALRRLSMV